MTWLRLRITASEMPSPLFVEDISNLLVIAGVETFTVEDFSDLEETLSGGGIFYDYIDDELIASEGNIPVLYAYFGTDEEGDATYAETIRALTALRNSEDGYASLVWSQDTVRDEDWENNWRQYFKPFPVGDTLTVKPTWEELPEELAKNRHIIEIDPSSSFGTGSHATTKLCLEKLEKVVRGGEHVLDMGCGSGILTIAAMKLGAGDAVAVDIDSVAARIAAENMEQNDLSSDVVKVLDGDILADKSLYETVGEGYDIICANIVAGIIIMMSDMFYEKLKVGGYLIASGIISEREEEVKKALISSGFTVIESEVLDDWSVILLKKKNNHQKI